MIVVKLYGGLGNQMFQYAAGRAMAKNRSVYFDPGFLRSNNACAAHFTARRFELGIFPNIRIKFADAFFPRLVNSHHGIFRLLRRLFRQLIKVVHDDQFKTIPGTKQHPGLIYLDGYFQHHFHLNKIRNLLLQDFAFPALNETSLRWAAKISSSENPVSVHVRRGDYLKPAHKSFHGLLPLTYYKEAIQVLDKRLNKPTYFIFSEDHEWCRTAFQFLGDLAIIVQTQDADWADMCLMSKCKHHVIANSSFSWWAAWLNPSDDKVVVAPKNWYINEQENNKTQTLIPKTWIRI
jgi:hypothetical protein